MANEITETKYKVEPAILKNTYLSLVLKLFTKKTGHNIIMGQNIRAVKGFTAKASTKKPPPNQSWADMVIKATTAQAKISKLRMNAVRPFAYLQFSIFCSEC